MRLHLLSLPHTATTPQYLTCAYTQKVVKFANMMTRRGHEVILYAGEQNEAECAELVTCITEEERAGWFGEGFDTVRTPFLWDANQEYWRRFNGRAISALLERVDLANDVLLLPTGWPVQPITIALGIHDGKRPMIACEWTVGYEGIFSEFCAFESQAWMHHVYGLREWRNGRFYDDVIPNFFDPDDFQVTPKDEYLLFVGRLVTRKGPHIAAQIAQRVGLPLVVAGPGGTQENGRVVAPEISLEGVEYVGEVGPLERSELMAGARALLCPTLYIEPFGGVAVEAMLSGTPAIGTDWGAFTETVEDGLTGYRFRTMAEAVEVTEAAVRGECGQPEEIRACALSKYGFDAVAPRFERWFDQLMSLWEQDWSA